MFNACTSASRISFGADAIEGKFSTSEVTDMSYMFANCNALTSITFGNSFDTLSVTSMKHMFSGCSGYEGEINIPFHTNKVQDMSYMFSGCNKLQTIKLGVNFIKTGTLFDTTSMFLNCDALLTIYCNNNLTGINHSDSMFYGCASINSTSEATKYDPSKVDCSYAKPYEGD